MKTIDPVAYLRELEIMEPKAAFPVSRDAGIERTSEGIEQSFLNAKSLVSFVITGVLPVTDRKSVV